MVHLKTKNLQYEISWTNSDRGVQLLFQYRILYASAIVFSFWKWESKISRKCSFWSSISKFSYKLNMILYCRKTTYVWHLWNSPHLKNGLCHVLVETEITFRTSKCIPTRAYKMSHRPKTIALESKRRKFTITIFKQDVKYKDFFFTTQWQNYSTTIKFDRINEISYFIKLY